MTGLAGIGIFFAGLFGGLGVFFWGVALVWRVSLENKADQKVGS